MARYIDADKGLRSRIQRKTRCNFITANEIVSAMKTADVIERARYEQLDKEANALSNAYQEEREKYKQLRLNVAKAIEEMERYGDSFDDIGKHNLGSAVENCIEILKRNIGESK